MPEKQCRRRKTEIRNSGIIEARHAGGHKLELFFGDGRSGIVDFAKYIEERGVLGRLADPEFFRTFRIDRESGGIAWSDEIEIDSDFLYSEATGAPLPAWMQESGCTLIVRLRFPAGNKRG